MPNDPVYMALGMLNGTLLLPVTNNERGRLRRSLFAVFSLIFCSLFFQIFFYKNSSTFLKILH